MLTARNALLDGPPHAQNAGKMHWEKIRGFRLRASALMDISLWAIQ
jgi:hypothetical protein